MPLYEYRCDACGRKVERLYQGYKDRPQTIVCQGCGSTATLRPSSGAFILKGPGFHKNDYPRRSQ